VASKALQNDKGNCFFSDPRMSGNCLHVTSTAFCKQRKTDIKSLSHCEGCEKQVESSWMCVSCGQIGCGRYSFLSKTNRFISGHALNHYEKSSHPIAIDIESLAYHW
jgi:uncharacterized UBP type Zn finger protein